MTVSSPPVRTFFSASDVADAPNQNSKPRCESKRRLARRFVLELVNPAGLLVLLEAVAQSRLAAPFVAVGN